MNVRLCLLNERMSELYGDADEEMISEAGDWEPMRVSSAILLDTNV